MIRDHVAGVGLLRRAGAGGGIVLLHGIGSDAASWLPMVAALDPGLAVMAWDAPGYGGSDRVGHASPTGYAERLEAVLNSMALDNVVLVGHSLGCLFATRFTVLHPGRVRALVLLSPALGYGVAPGAPLPPNVQARIDDLESLGPEVFAERRARRLVYRPEAKPDVLAGVRRAMAAVDPVGYAHAVRALGAGTLLEDAARIGSPAFVAVGAEDVVAPPANALLVRDALVGARELVLVPDAGHALPQEAPDVVAGMVMEISDV